MRRNMRPPPRDTLITDYYTHAGKWAAVFLLYIQPEGGNSPGNSKFPGIFCCKFLNVVPALLADTAVLGDCKNVAARSCAFQAQNTPKCVCGRASLRTMHWGKILHIFGRIKQCCLSRPCRPVRVSK